MIFYRGSRPPVPPLDPPMRACYREKMVHILCVISHIYYAQARLGLRCSHMHCKIYSITYLKWPLSKRPNMVFKTDYRLMQVESFSECPLFAILSTFFKLPVVVKTFVCLFFEWPFTQVVHVSKHQKRRQLSCQLFFCVNLHILYF